MSANVTSLDALRQLRVALVEFAETARETMTGLDMELSRGMQWLLETQPQFWHQEQRRLADRVQEARIELTRRRGMALPGEVASCTEQKMALEKAVIQLRHVEDKAKVTKHWGRVVEHESREWLGRANQFNNLVESDLPRAIALLDRSIASIEAYLGVSMVQHPATSSGERPPAPPSPEPPDASG
jgi:hypothetical protein